MAVEPGVSARVVRDETWPRAVVANLLGDAVKYTPAGQVGLTVSAGAPQPSRPIPFSFEVTDTGPGIREDQVERVFDPFYRGGAGGAEQGFGVGPGDARRLVTLMGGGTGVSSTTGKGSTFNFTLPLAAADACAGDPCHATRGAALVVDDHTSKG